MCDPKLRSAPVVARNITQMSDSEVEWVYKSAQPSKIEAEFEGEKYIITIQFVPFEVRGERVDNQPLPRFNFRGQLAMEVTKAKSD